MIKVFSWNILAASLGSATTPWTMRLPKESEHMRQRLAEHYKRHFHKNQRCYRGPHGQYWLVRQLWSARSRLTSLPEEMELAQLRDDGGFAYGEEEVAYPLVELVDADTFRLLMRLEDEVFGWQARRPRILQRILRSDASLVALQEYDRDEEVEPQLRAAGYECIFFEGATGLSGKLSAWKTSEWQAEGGAPRQLAFDEHVGHLASNWDFQEQGLVAADRRTLSLVRLRHVGSGRLLSFANVHLMTTSRCPEGKLRRGELRFAAERLRDEQQLILCGDFNTTPAETAVFEPLSALQLTNVFEEQYSAPLAATSVNGVRRKCIDYVFCSPSLTVQERSSIECPAGADYPSETEPSDHIPLQATLLLST